MNSSCFLLRMFTQITWHDSPSVRQYIVYQHPYEQRPSLLRHFPTCTRSCEGSTGHRRRGPQRSLWASSEPTYNTVSPRSGNYTGFCRKTADAHDCEIFLLPAPSPPLSPAILCEKYLRIMAQHSVVSVNVFATCLTAGE